MLKNTLTLFALCAMMFASCTLEDDIETLRERVSNEQGYNGYTGSGTSTGTGGVTASATSSSSITISWPSVSGASIYYISRSSSASGSYETVGYSYSTSYTDTGLSANTTYYYLVQVLNNYMIDVGTVSVTTWSSSSGGGGVPNAPTGVTATATSSTITVSWNSVPGATEYRIYRSSDGYDYTFTYWTSSTLCTDNFGNPQQNKTVYYRVSAVNSYGESPQSASVSATMGTSSGGGGYLDFPTGVTATAISSSAITVSWYSVPGATSYEVWYEIGSSTTKYFAGSTTSTSYTHTGLTASTNYWYNIKAKNSSGESSYSSYANATTSSY